MTQIKVLKEHVVIIQQREKSKHYSISSICVAASLVTINLLNYINRSFCLLNFANVGKCPILHLFKAESLL